MTREEAIAKVKGYLTDLLPSEEYDEVEEIIKALKQEPCEDAVSRRAVKELLDEYYAELTLDETALKSNAIAIKVVRNIMNDIKSL